MPCSSFRPHVVPAALACALTACGGSSSSPGTPSLSISADSLSATVATTSANAVLSDPLTITLSQPAAGASYYYKISFTGSAVSSVTLTGVAQTIAHPGNPAAANPQFLGYAIGADLYGPLPGSGQEAIGEIALVAPARLGAGTYKDALAISVCTDAACTHPVADSPKTVSLTYTVTGNPKSSAAASVANSPVKVESATTQSAASAAIAISALNLPPTGAYVTWSDGSGGLVSAGTLETKLGTAGAATVPASLNLALSAPSNIGAGQYQDTVTVNVCLDTKCAIPVTGSPLSVAISYSVDAAVVTGLTQQTLPLDVEGLAWSAKTGKLYASVDSTSTQNPNTLAQINPASGIVETAVQLEGSTQLLGALAISGDGSYLYVAVQDSSNLSYHVDRVRTADLGIDLQIPLPANALSPVLKPAPAMPHTLGVMYDDTSNGNWIVIYDDSTSRGPPLAAATMSGDPNEFVIGGFSWSSDASAMYVDLFGFHLPTVMAALTTAAPGPTAATSMHFQNTAVGDMDTVNGLVMFGTGDVFNPASFAFETPFSPATPGALAQGNAAFDSGLNRAYFIDNTLNGQSPAGPILVQAFNLTTRGLLWSAQLQSTETPSYLTRWGANGLAFRAAPTGSNPAEVVLLSGAAIAQ
jgi:hypothetical protein